MVVMLGMVERTASGSNARPIEVLRAAVPATAKLDLAGKLARSDSAIEAFGRAVVPKNALCLPRLKNAWFES